MEVDDAKKKKNRKPALDDHVFKYPHTKDFQLFGFEI